MSRVISYNRFQIRADSGAAGQTGKRTIAFPTLCIGAGEAAAHFVSMQQRVCRTLPDSDPAIFLEKESGLEESFDRVANRVQERRFVRFQSAVLEPARIMRATGGPFQEPNGAVAVRNLASDRGESKQRPGYTGEIRY